MKQTVLSSLLILVFLFGCKKEEPAPMETTSPGTLTLQNSQYGQLEIAVLESTDVSFTQSTYVGTINGMSVQLVVDGEQVYFVVPNVSAGTHNIEVTINSNSYSVPIEITATAIPSDVDAFINTETTALFDLTSLNTALSDLGSLTNSSEDATNIAFLNDVQTEFNILYAQMSIAEKEELAKYISANQALFSADIVIDPRDSLNINRTTLGVYQGDFADDVGDILIYTGSGLLITNGGVAMLHACAVPGAGLLPCAGGLLTVYAGVKILKKAKAKVLNVADKTYVLIETRFKNFLQRSTVTHNQEYAVQAEGNRRTLYEGDQSSQISIVQSFWSACSSFQETWNKIKQLADDFASTFNSNNSVVGSFPHPEDKNSYDSQWLGEGPQYLSVGNITNSNVSVSNQYVQNDELRITFQSSSQTNENFSFDLIYNDGTFSTSSTHTATITPEIDSTQIYFDACVGGGWTVTHNTANPVTVYDMTLNADGTGYYTVNGTDYGMNWGISRNSTGYRYYESGFWNAGYNGIPTERLSWPVSGFRTMDTTGVHGGSGGSPVYVHQYSK